MNVPAWSSGVPTPWVVEPQTQGWKAPRLTMKSLPPLPALLREIPLVPGASKRSAAIA